MRKIQTHIMRAMGIATLVLILSLISCSSSDTLIDVHGFSNIEVSEDFLWFGAGSKLYKVDLNLQSATMVYDTNDVAISFVEVEGDRIYFGGPEYPQREISAIWAFDRTSDSMIWKQEFNEFWRASRFATPLIIHENVLIIGTNSTLNGIDSATGRVEWSINNYFRRGERLSPILVDGEIVYGVTNEEWGGDESISGRVLVFANPASGEIKKTIVMPGNLGAIPAIRENCIFVKDYQYRERDASGRLQYIGVLRLNCVDLNTGKIIWTHEGHGVPLSSQPVFHNGIVFDVFAEQLIALDEQSGAVIWQSVELGGGVRHPQVIEDTGIVALEIPEIQKLLFLDLISGSLLDTEFYDVLSSPVFIGQDAIFGTPNSLVRVNIDNENIIWSIQVDSKYQLFEYES